MKEQFVDIQQVRDNPDGLWDLFWLSHNEQLTVKDIEDLKLSNSRGNWHWFYISAYIHINEVRNNPNKPWNKEGLSCNKRLTVKDVEALKLDNSDVEWDWDDISRFTNIDEVINNPTKPWVRDWLEYNSCITCKILEFFNAGLLKHLQRNIPKFKYRTDIAIKCE